VTKAA